MNGRIRPSIVAVVCATLIAGCRSQPIRHNLSPLPPVTVSRQTPASQSAARSSVGNTVVTSVASLPSAARLNMMSASVGWAVGNGVVWRTVDGGKAWAQVTPPDVQPTFHLQVAFLNSQTAWAIVPGASANSGTVVQTVDGGIAWKHVTAHMFPLYGAPANSTSLSFVDAQHGWLLLVRGAAAGSEAVDVYRTVDGGMHWALSSQTAPNANVAGELPLYGSKNGIRFLTDRTGWVNGFSAQPGVAWLYVTHDGGNAWAAQTLNLPPAFKASALHVAPPAALKGGNVIIPVRALTSRPLVAFYSSADGGATWNESGPKPFTAYAFASSNMIWATDGHQLFRSTDLGSTWSGVSAKGLDLSKVSQLDFLNANTGWAVVSGKAKAAAQIYRTSDGGRSWERL